MIDAKWDDTENVSDVNGSNGSNHVNEDDNNEEDNDAESGQEITEFWLIPEIPSDVENIYFFMSKYPAAEGMDDSDDEDEEFFDGEDMQQMNINDDENDPRFADD